MIAWVLPLLLAPQGFQAGTGSQADAIDGHGYVALDTRGATYERMRALLLPNEAEWGDWYQLTPFPYGGIDSGDMAAAYEPEAELEKMGAGGPGPDLERTYAGKNGVEASWSHLGVIHNQMVDLHTFEDPELRDYALCYLYSTVRAERARSIDLTLGTDDGVRFWLNGELLLDHDVPRGLDPEAEQLTLDLQPGLNHVLVKVTEGQGDWAFQINSRQPLTGRQDAHLQYLLDRDFPPSTERDHYRVMTVPVPQEIALEVGGLAFLEGGDPVVTTRRGDVFRVRGAYDEPPLDASFELFAGGLHEPLGAAVRREGQRDAVYTVQRGELTRLTDEDGDGSADYYQTFSDGWGLSGNYHEFAFGPKFDAAGNAWVTLNVGFCGSLGKAMARWRGWALKIDRNGRVIPVCDGLRSPNGIGAWSDGEMFYVDNQGDYVATNRLSHLVEGSWHGHPASLRWRTDLADPGARPARQPASVWFPYKKMGQSAADIALDTTGGAFGPFAGQMFVGDQTSALVMRVTLEEVDGLYQGACYPFLEGLDCGVNRLAFAADGSLFVGQTDRGWGSVGRLPYGLQRVVYTGETPFEIAWMRAREDGFELEFTEDVDPETATDVGSYDVTSYTYEYHAAYGAPEEGHAPVPVVAAELVDSRRVRLRLVGLREGYVHELHADGLRSSAGGPLLHPEAYYTLQHVPGRERRTPESELPKLLFLTHSAGFEHEVVKRPDPYVLATAEERLIEAAQGRYQVVATQDPSVLSAAGLAEHDAVLLFTTGALPVDGGKDALMDWVWSGGAFAGVHSASDTWLEEDDYAAFLGGTFDGHPWTQEVSVNVLDPGHPATAHFDEAFAIEDEIYQFDRLVPEAMHVLLALDPYSVDASLGKREDGFYPLAWTRAWGQGRVFYTALGHAPEVWGDERFLEHLLGGLDWARAEAGQEAPAPIGAVGLEAPDAWTHRGGEDFGWELVGANAYEVGNGVGDLVSRQRFGDARLHVEFRLPPIPEEERRQLGGNSGVYVHGRYEVQVIDSEGVEEPGTGDCGGIYDQKPPDVNAASPPEVWQSYDMIFRAPRFDSAGNKVGHARLTVWHNGRLIHDDVELGGPTPGGLADDEVAEGPLLLQDHGNAVRYRNVWFQPL